MATDPGKQQAERASLASRALRQFRPSHQHTAFSATLLLMGAVTLSRIIGFLRETYIASAFGAGLATDAYNAAFTLPDYLNHLVAGGTASITFISIYSRSIAAGRQQEAERAFSIIITVASTVLVVGIAVAEIFAPQITRALFPKFTAEQVELCVYLTRILLPAQLFFYVGGVVAAVLSARRMFLLPAMAPLFYNLFIILGGVALGARMGIASLAVGALAGAFVGPFLLNAIGVARAHVRYRPDFQWRHPAFREWLRMTVPLLLGVSVVAADDWIMRYFASGGEGDISRLNYAKRLFLVPAAVLGQAVGQASLPFFAKLWGEQDRGGFAGAVNRAVSNTIAFSLVASAWMAACAAPLVDLVYRRGRFTESDGAETAVLLAIFSFSLAFWAAQGLYARAFYASGDTWTPMIAATVVTAAAIFVYWSLFAALGVPGLAWASNSAIVLHTVAILALLHARGIVSAAGLRWSELGKALAAAAVSFFAAQQAIVFLGEPQSLATYGVHAQNAARLLAGSLAWAAAAALVLWLTRSTLLRELRSRR